MESNNTILIILLLAHVVLAIWAFLVASKAPMWSGGKKIFAKITALLIPIFGPLLIIIASKYFGKGGVGDSRLPHSVDVLANSDETGSPGGSS